MLLISKMKEKKTFKYLISDIGTIMWPIASAYIQPYAISIIVQTDLLKRY